MDCFTFVGTMLECILVQSRYRYVAIVAFAVSSILGIVIVLVPGRFFLSLRGVTRIFLFAASEGRISFYNKIDGREPSI